MQDYRNSQIQEFILDKEIPFSNRLFFTQHLMPYLFFAESCRDRRVLEIGTGQSYGVYHLAKTARIACGIDMDLSSEALFRGYKVKYAKDNMLFTCADARKLPFKKGSFDRIISCQVIEHIPETELCDFLEGIKYILKDDGILFISTLNLEHNLKNPLTYEKFPQHHKEFMRDELYALLKSVFPQVEMYGLYPTLKHRFFLRLKRWGFFSHSFFDNISPRDFRISPGVSRLSSDLLALCFKS